MDLIEKAGQRSTLEPRVFVPKNTVAPPWPPLFHIAHGDAVGTGFVVRARAKTVGKNRKILSLFDDVSEQNRTRLRGDDFHWPYGLREKIQLRRVVTRECNRIECQ